MSNPEEKPHAGKLPKAEKRRLHNIRMERLPRVVKAYLQGISVRDIARSEKVSFQTIYGDLRYARKVWLKKVEESADEYLTVEVEKINLIESEAWSQWERSKEDAVEKSIEKDAAGKSTKKRRTQKGQCGDSRYLDVALRCVDKRCRMLRIGEYSKEDALAVQARVVEVVVENADQVNRILDYGEYDELLKPSEN